jgi:hypothetical protein
MLLINADARLRTGIRGGCRHPYLLGPKPSAFASFATPALGAAPQWLTAPLRHRCHQQTGLQFRTRRQHPTMNGQGQVLLAVPISTTLHGVHSIPALIHILLGLNHLAQSAAKILLRVP